MSTHHIAQLSEESACLHGFSFLKTRLFLQFHFLVGFYDFFELFRFDVRACSYFQMLIWKMRLKIEVIELHCQDMLRDVTTIQGN